MVDPITLPFRCMIEEKLAGTEIHWHYSKLLKLKILIISFDDEQKHMVIGCKDTYI